MEEDLLGIGYHVEFKKIMNEPGIPGTEPFKLTESLSGIVDKK
jgi:hypothetical protein